MSTYAAAALVPIDVQQGFDEPVWGERNNPTAERNIARLLAGWREDDRPIFHVRHSSTEPDSPLRPDRSGWSFKPEGEPRSDEPVFEKSVNSGFIGTDLAETLEDAGVTQLVFAGFTTDHCVSTTVRMAANLGFEPIVVADATATFDRAGHDGTQYDAELSHRLALAHLRGEFAAIVETDDILGGV